VWCLGFSKPSSIRPKTILAGLLEKLLSLLFDPAGGHKSQHHTPQPTQTHNPHPSLQLPSP